MIKYQNKYRCKEGWFNIYKKYDYQEFHDHGKSTLSAVYFLKSNPKKSSKIYFKFLLQFITLYILYNKYNIYSNIFFIKIPNN